jgi:thioesterase domain-containing protein
VTGNDVETLARRIAALDGASRERLERLAPTEAAPTRAADDVLVRLRDGTGAPCVLAPPSVGDLRKLGALAGALRPRPVHGLVPPERERGERGVELRGRLVERAGEAVRAAYPDGPCALGGFCLGGLFALSTAEIVERRGGRVAGLVMIDTLFASGRLGRRLVRVADAARHHAANFRNRSIQQRVSYLFARLAGIPDYLRSTRSQRRWLEDASSHDAALASTVEAFSYFAPRRTDVPILVVYGREGKPEGSEAGWRRRWGSVAGAGLRWASLPASHETLFDERNLALLARRIDDFFLEIGLA